LPSSPCLLIRVPHLPACLLNILSLPVISCPVLWFSLQFPSCSTSPCVQPPFSHTIITACLPGLFCSTTLRACCLLCHRCLSTCRAVVLTACNSWCSLFLFLSASAAPACISSVALFCPLPSSACPLLPLYTLLFYFPSCLYMCLLFSFSAFLYASSCLPVFIACCSLCMISSFCSATQPHTLYLPGSAIFSSACIYIHFLSLSPYMQY